jgi:hypothetical protein
MTTDYLIDSASRLAPAVRMVTGILKSRGEISIADIEAIPLVLSSNDVSEVLRKVSETLSIELDQRKVESTPILRWERVVRLREPTLAD